MMLLGQKLDASEAATVGLLNRVVPASELDAAVKALVDALAAKSPTALRLGLRAFAAQDDMDLERALPMLRERLAECLGTDDAREGLAAFLEKRSPRWTGKSASPSPEGARERTSGDKSASPSPEGARERTSGDKSASPSPEGARERTSRDK
jgi:hypothetical protein